MATQAQIIANRLNAQKSTGPSTPEGKALASKNSLKHGLSARCDVVITESQEEYDIHRDSLLSELSPQTPMESMLADRIVSLSWRLKRADLIQNQTIDAMHEKSTTSPFNKFAKSLCLKRLGIPQPDPADANPDLILGRLALKDFSNARVLDRILMYERRIEHSLFKTTLELQRLHRLRDLQSPPTHLAPGTAGGSSSPNRQQDNIRQGANTQNEPNSKTATMNLTLYNKSNYGKASPSSCQKNEPNRTQFIAAKPLANPQRTQLNPNKPLFQRKISHLQTREKTLQSTCNSCGMEKPPLVEQESKILEKQC
jgi:hypothetical protein